MNIDCFWIHNVSNLMHSWNINILQPTEFCEKLNRCTRLLLIVFIVLCIFQYKYDVEFLIIGIFIIFLSYYIQKSSMNIEHYQPNTSNIRIVKIGIEPPPRMSNEKTFSYTLPFSEIDTSSKDKTIQVPFPSNPDYDIALNIRLFDKNIPIPINLQKNQTSFKYKLPWHQTITVYIPDYNPQRCTQNEQGHEVCTPLRPQPTTMRLVRFDPNSITFSEFMPTRVKSPPYKRKPIYENTQIYNPPTYEDQIPPVDIHCQENLCQELSNLSYDYDCNQVRNTIPEEFETQEIQVDIVPSPYDNSTHIIPADVIHDKNNLSKKSPSCEPLPAYNCNTFDTNQFIYDPKEFGYGTSYRCEKDEHINRTQYNYDDVAMSIFVDPFRQQNHLLHLNQNIDRNCPIDHGNQLTQNYNRDKELFYNNLTKEMVDKIKCKNKFMEENPMRKFSYFK